MLRIESMVKNRGEQILHLGEQQEEQIDHLQEYLGAYVHPVLKETELSEDPEVQVK